MKDTIEETAGRIMAQSTSNENLLRQHSFGALLLTGIAAGAVLGALNGLWTHHMMGVFESHLSAGLWGGILGVGGGCGVVLLRRMMWGPTISATVGTALGWMFGILPGTILLLRAIFVNQALLADAKVTAGLIMAASMLGMLVGGLLDRTTEVFLHERSDDLTEN